MREFIYYSENARTSGNFDVNNLMKAGRMDIVCQIIIMSFFTSHHMREDVKLHHDPIFGRWVVNAGCNFSRRRPLKDIPNPGVWRFYPRLWPCLRRLLSVWKYADRCSVTEFVVLLSVWVVRQSV